MDAKEILKELTVLENTISSKRFMAQSYRELAEGMQSQKYSDMPKNQNRQIQPMVDALNKAMEIEEEIIELEQLLQEKKTFVMDNIYEIDSNEFQIVLIKRYFEKKSWKQISEVHYSERWIYKLHGTALEEMSQCIQVQVCS